MESMEGLEGKRILVTGVGGFIGSHLANSLAKIGALVTGIDINISQKSYFIRNSVYSQINFQFLDIRNKNNVAEFIEELSPEVIFHLAAKTLVTESIINPHDTFETNIMGTVNILEAARNLSNLESIVVASSDKAYGKTSRTYTEKSPLNGDHPYDVSKSATDLIATTYNKSYGLPVVISRFGNVYGEGDMNMDRIIPGICQSIINGQKLLIRSNGKYVRDYVYVDDVVSGYIFLAINRHETVGQAYNFSSKDTLSVLDLIKKFEKITSQKLDFEIINNAKNEIPYQHLNDLKVRRLGWKNNWTLEEVIDKILNWYRQNL